MTYDNFTVKAQQGITKGQAIAKENEQQYVDTAHLLKGLMLVDENIISYLFQKMGIDMEKLHKQLNTVISTYPKIEGNQKQYLTKEANQSVRNAKTIMQEMDDKFISVEVFVLGIMQNDDLTSKMLKNKALQKISWKKASKNWEKGVK